jgi:Aldehyde dehydrogenase family
VKGRGEAIRYMQRSMAGTPLCLYVFTTSSAVMEEVRLAVPAGSCVQNDCLVHLSSSSIPFGGLGTSGYGNYHGRYTFDCFSHRQPVMYRPCIAGADMFLTRYHPFTDLKAFLLTKVVVILPPIPNLHLRNTLVPILVLLVAALFSRQVSSDPWHEWVILPLARGLEGAASWLREGCAAAAAAV